MNLIITQSKTTRQIASVNAIDNAGPNQPLKSL